MEPQEKGSHITLQNVMYFPQGSVPALSSTVYFVSVLLQGIIPGSQLGKQILGLREEICRYLLIALEKCQIPGTFSRAETLQNEHLYKKCTCYL